MDLIALRKSNHPFYGVILENFVETELLKAFNNQPFHLYHFRKQTQKEVDFILERQDGKIIGLEVKAKSHIDTHDLKGLKILKEMSGDSFVKGIVLHSGNTSYSLGDSFYALPFSVLWNGF